MSVPVTKCHGDGSQLTFELGTNLSLASGQASCGKAEPVLRESDADGKDLQRIA